MGIAVVTGGGRGIGAAASTRLAADGYRVLLTYNRSSRPAEDVVDKIRTLGGDAVAIRVDCSDADEVSLMGLHAWMAHGVDVLVLNHGAYDRNDARDVDNHSLRKAMSVNFEGAVAVWKTLQKHLSDDARIVVIGSQLGTRGSPHGAEYSASKAALATWARSLAQAVGPEGQRVNVIAPGYVDTDILAGDSVEKRKMREEEVPQKRIGLPEDIAGVVSFLVGPDSSYVNGAIIHVNGGLYLP